ncbi:hypothetical protein V7152_13120 [Neobacillus drentensis]|uniref:hypothetical protein n=1 Tax=Neobacillus drentensis TaxID=220684 RepID=UPI002FFFC05A
MFALQKHRHHLFIYFLSSDNTYVSNLALCMGRKLYSANDFQDVVALFKRQRQMNRTNASAQQIETSEYDISELTLVHTDAQQRPLED